MAGYVDRTVLARRVDVEGQPIKFRVLSLPALDGAACVETLRQHCTIRSEPLLEDFSSHHAQPVVVVRAFTLVDGRGELFDSSRMPLQ